MSLHPRTALRPGRDAGLLSQPIAKTGRLDPDIPIPKPLLVYDNLALFRLRTLIGATFCFHHRPLERSHACSEWENSPLSS